MNKNTFNGKRIAIIGTKGGSGKTTTALHLAYYLSEIGEVLLIDSDTENQTALRWANRGYFNFETVFLEDAPAYMGGKDFVIIDGKANMQGGNLAELGAGCDLIIIPTKPDITNLETLDDNISELPQEANYRILICQVPSYPSKEGREAKEYLESFNYPIFSQMVRHAAGFPRAAKFGHVVAKENKMAWSDYRAIGKEVEELING